MNLSLKRINSIFQKDLKEFSRNYAISSMLLMPLVFAFIYGRLGTEDGVSLMIHLLVVNLTFGMCTAYIQCCLLAEEKEHHTLRGLMLSPASILDILLGKSLLTFVSSAIILTLSLKITHFNPEQLWLAIVVFTLNIIFYIGVGTLFSLVTNSIVGASFASLPVMLIAVAGSSVVPFADKHIIFKLITYLPGGQLYYLLDAPSQAGLIKGLMITIAWVVVVWAVTALLYNKQLTK